MKGQTLNRRPTAPTTGRNRIRPLTQLTTLGPRPTAKPRRPATSAWKEQARAALAPASTPAPETRPMREAQVIEIASTLRQPKLWDVRVEPRSMSLLPPREERIAPAPRTATRTATRTASTPRREPTRREPTRWEWCEAVALIGIALGAIAQLAQVVK